MIKCEEEKREKKLVLISKDQLLQIKIPMNISLSPGILCLTHGELKN